MAWMRRWVAMWLVVLLTMAGAVPALAEEGQDGLGHGEVQVTETEAEPHEADEPEHEADEPEHEAGIRAKLAKAAREAAKKAAEAERELAHKARETERELAHKAREAQAKLREATSKLAEAEEKAAAHPERAEQLLAKARQKAEELEARAEALIRKAEEKTAELQAKGEAKIAEVELEAAVASLKAAAKLNPASREIYRKLGHLYKELGKEAIKVWVKGAPVEVQPIVQDGRTLIPLRALSEALGAEVAWNSADQTVTFTKGGNTVQLAIGSPVVRFNGEEVTIDVPAALQNGRTVVPLRAIAQLLAAQVDYDPETGNVIVTDPNAVPEVDDDDPGSEESGESAGDGDSGTDDEEGTSNP